MGETKFCKHCGESIDKDCIVCPMCGKQVERLNIHQQQPGVIINNTNNHTAYFPGHTKNKWVSLLLCFFLGFLGAHKFYERKYLLGIIYVFTLGLCGIGVIIDFIVILFKPNPYYV